MNFQGPSAQPARRFPIQTRAILCISTSTKANYSTISECRGASSDQHVLPCPWEQGFTAFFFFLPPFSRFPRGTVLSFTSIVICTSTNQIHTTGKPQKEMPSPWHYWPKGQLIMLSVWLYIPPTKLIDHVFSIDHKQISKLTMRK